MERTMNSIDVIIPSFRLREDSLFSIISMNKPTNYKVRFLIIQDNPSRKISNNFRKHIDDDNILLIQNKTNSGSSFSRNVGINNSNAQWILFIDDDVKHRKDLLIKIHQCHSKIS